MPKLCKCGAIVAKRCERCYPSTHAQTTTERGYGQDWRQLSEKYRTINPLCERCMEQDKATPADHVHHKIKIVDAPHLRLSWDNLMSVCVKCHNELEGSNAGKYLRNE